MKLIKSFHAFNQAVKAKLAQPEQRIYKQIVDESGLLHTFYSPQEFRAFAENRIGVQA